MTLTPEYADRHGWMLDTSSIPWLAYRGPQWAPYATAHVIPNHRGIWPFPEIAVAHAFAVIQGRFPQHGQADIA